MKEFKYTEEQLNKISNFLNQVEVRGSNSITAMAVVFQELNNGDVIIPENEGE